MKLTALDVTRATKSGLYGDGGNLYLQVSHSGAKSWVFRYQIDGRSRTMGLGSASAISLKRARELAVEPRRLVAERIDPIDARHAQRATTAVHAAGAITFKAFAGDYIRLHQHGWKSDKHRQQWEASLATFIYPVFGDVPVRDVDTPLVLKALQPIWTTKPEAASRTRGHVESILDAAKAAGLRSGENPARWKGHLKSLLPAPRKLRAIRHFPALAYQAVPAFLQDLRTRQGVAAQALAFAILTAARGGEVNASRWTEIDFDSRTWTIPASRMKAGREHRVPLSDAAVALLRSRYDIRSGEYIFSAGGNRPLGATSMLAMLKLMDRRDIVVHGFRSSFRDWAAETTAYPSEVVEQALAHTVGSAVERAYRRGDLFEKRRRLMDAWGQYCERVQATAGVVTPIVNIFAASD
jgi:integrase